MKKPIVTDISILKQKSEPCNDYNELSEILKHLEDSLDITKGIGLSAIQIGILKQIAIIRIGEKKINLINACITDRAYKFRMIGEGCLSIPAIHIDTVRYTRIKYISNGKEYIADGLESIAIQHELDHFKGLTILDRKWRSR